MNMPNIAQRIPEIGYKQPEPLFDLYVASGTTILITKRDIGLDAVYRVVQALEGSVNCDNNAVSICVVSAGFDPNFKYWDSKLNITKPETFKG